MKILLDGSKSSHWKRKDSKLEDVQRELNIKWSTEKSKHIEKEQKSRDLWDNIKWSNFHLIGDSERMGSERISEQIMAEKFSKVMNSVSPQI